MQLKLGNRAVSELLAPPGLTPPSPKDIASGAGLPVIRNEERAESDALPAANATLAKSKSVARSLEGTGPLPPMGYWFAKLYELITEAEISERGQMRHPGFMLEFIPFFYDLYEHNVGRDRHDKEQASRAARSERGGHDAQSSDWLGEIDWLEALGERLEPGPASTVWPAWSSYFKEADINDAFTAGASVPIERLVRQPLYVLNTYLAGATESILAGISSHINGDMANALAFAYDNLRAKYMGAGPFAKYKEDFFERNRPIFDTVRVKLVAHLLQKLRASAEADFDDAKFMLALGDRFGVGGPRVDEIYRWRAAAWDTAQAEIDQRLDVRMGMQPGGPGIRRVPPFSGHVGPF